MDLTGQLIDFIFFKPFPDSFVIVEAFAVQRAVPQLGTALGAEQGAFIKGGFTVKDLDHLGQADVIGTIRQFNASPGSHHRFHYTVFDQLLEDLP